MTLKDAVAMLNWDQKVTVENQRGEILVDCDIADRIGGFMDEDEGLRKIRYAKVYHIEVGKVFGDIIFSVAV